MEYFGLIIGIVIFLVFVLLIRLFGAWMFRIDEVINNQKAILEELKNGNGKIE